MLYSNQELHLIRNKEIEFIERLSGKNIDNNNNNNNSFNVLINALVSIILLVSNCLSIS